jgi:hypothetical protein
MISHDNAFWTSVAFLSNEPEIAQAGKNHTIVSYLPLSHIAAQVRKTPSWPRLWANSSLLSRSHRNAWANLRLLGQPNAVLARRRWTSSSR